MKNINPSTTGNSAAVSFSELRMVLDSPKTQSHMHEMAHWHDELEGIYVLTGSMDFYLDDRKLTLSSGDFLLITSSAMHYSKAHDEKDSLFLRLFIQPALFSASESLHPLLLPFLEDRESEFLLLRAEKNPESLKDLLLRMHKLLETRPAGFPLECAGLVHILLARLYPLIHQSDVIMGTHMGPDVEAQRRMIAYIRKNYPEKITLADIAEAGLMSRSKCCQLFKKYVNRTPMDFLNTYRLEMSLRLLKETERPISDISLSCGFTSQSYFTKLFTERYHMTPSGCRKK